MQLPDFLTVWPFGAIVIKGHRIGLYHVIRRCKDGMTAEQLHEWYPTLERELIEKILDFYHANRNEVETYLTEVEAEMDRNYAATPRRDGGSAPPEVRGKATGQPGLMHGVVLLPGRTPARPLWQAIQQHNAVGVHPLEVLRVGDPPAPPLGTSDPDLLLWSEASGCILISEDHNTLPGFLTQHLQGGRHIPGLFLIRRGWTISAVVFALILRDQASDPQDFVDQLEYIP